ncbi:MAG: 3-hydroxyacyl-ACP dehydratase FabZ [Deltaproteobacteria bacterium]|nr:3-hydroxyacyl-ACP dehydratase FabZ [Deltaproteobacteria bacterium]
MSIPPSLDQERICELLPHRPPALMIEMVTDVKPGEYAVGIKTVRPGDSFLQGHFPDQPVMPGVAIIECMAQTAAVLSHLTAPEALSTGAVVLLGIDRARFRRPVVPGDTLRIEVRIVQRRDPIWKFHGLALVGNEKAAEAMITAGLTTRGEWTFSPTRSKPEGKR